jgi:hypothetical protein
LGNKLEPNGIANPCGLIAKSIFTGSKPISFQISSNCPRKKSNSKSKPITSVGKAIAGGSRKAQSLIPLTQINGSTLKKVPIFTIL